ncbi:MAG: hypothetical protein AMXMBFR66_12800 [Pseudomonadota bacterium]|nr:phospholipid carrier-dependent glycosyltransferase [Rubrivivax sp.]
MPAPPSPASTTAATAAAATPHRQRSAWLLGALALWLLATAGTRALLLPDEGRYVGVAYAMLQGDWLVPRLDGLPFFHKPPLMYWIDAAALRLVGVNEIGARAAPLLGALVMAAAIGWDLRRRTDAHRAALVLGALATSPLFYFGAQYANLDMLVAGLVTAAVVLGARAGEPAAALGWAAAAWVAAALAVLAKGLIGVVLPALVLLPWLLWRRRWRGLARLVHPLALAAFALVALPWFVAMQMRYPGFFDYFFVEQHLRRYAQGGFNNAQPAWFYLAVLPLLTLPWSLALPAVRRLRRIGEDTRPPHPGGGVRQRPTADRAHRPNTRADTHPPQPDDVLGRQPDDALGRQPDGTAVALYAWWVCVVLVFFSLPQSKLVGYVLPALGPFVALLVLAATAGQRRLAWRWGLALGALLCLAASVYLARTTALPSQRDVARALAARMQPGDRVVLVGAPYFDVAFYARLGTPPAVLADWNAPGFAERDDWRKELRDAARFEPARGAQLLWPLERTAALACSAQRLWWVAAHDWQPPAAAGGATRVLQGRSAALWLSTRPAACP